MSVTIGAVVIVALPRVHAHRHDLACEFVSVGDDTLHRRPVPGVAFAAVDVWKVALGRALAARYEEQAEAEECEEQAMHGLDVLWRVRPTQVLGRSFRLRAFKTCPTLSPEVHQMNMDVAWKNPRFGSMPLLKLAFCVLSLLSLLSSSALSAQESEEPADALSVSTPDHALSLADLYEASEKVLWTHPAGLSSLGQSAVRWLRDAPHHGVAGFAPLLKEVEKHLALLVPHAGPASKAPELVISGKDVAQELRSPAAQVEPLHPRHARVLLEAGIAKGISELARQLAHRPRTEAILWDENKRYATPDVLWKREMPRLNAADLKAMMEAVSAGDEAFDGWLAARLPPVAQYQALLEASRTYAAICEEGGWPEISVTRYRRGKRWKDEVAIRALQERLQVEDFYKGEPNGVYDDAMKEAVRSYQASRQLRANGRYDRATSLELNIPCEERLATLRLNLKRWRQTARKGEPTYVEVNLASQEVRYVLDATERMRKRTVVGSGKWFWSRKHKQRIYPKKSPLLTDAIQKIVVNPSWTIPGSIVKQEILPRVEKDPTYLERKGYVVKKSKRGNDIYVQPPGPNNTLGEVKLLFPNAEAIYLHDTNNRYLFRTARRDMSHGCIRVQDALDFASILMADEHARLKKSFHPRALHRLSRRTKTAVFKLDTPIPIFLEYYTASVDTEGIVRFHPDVYEYDLEIALGGPVPRRLPKALRR